MWGELATPEIRLFDQQPLRDDAPIVQKDEGDLKEPLEGYLKQKRVPRKLWPKAAAEMERLVRRLLAGNVDRPKWNNRRKHPELEHLSAPEFLKTVWADVIGPDGTIETEIVRNDDVPLMNAVRDYLDNRRTRGLDLGRARGLNIVSIRQRKPRKPLPENSRS